MKVEDIRGDQMAIVEDVKPRGLKAKTKKRQSWRTQNRENNEIRKD